MLAPYPQRPKGKMDTEPWMHQETQEMLNYWGIDTDTEAGLLVVNALKGKGGAEGGNGKFAWG